MGGGVARVGVPRAAGSDSAYTALGGGDDLRRWWRSLGQPEEMSGGATAEDRPVSSREDGCKVGRLDTRRSMPRPVDARVDPDQRAPLQQPGDLVPGNPRLQQLPPRRHPVLAARDLPDNPFRPSWIGLPYAALSRNPSEFAPLPSRFCSAADRARRLESPHALPQARRLGHRGLGDLARLLADLRRGGGARPDGGLHARRLRRRHHALRHLERIRAGHRRDGVGRDPLRLRPRLLRARDEAVLPDDRDRSRPLARADPQAARLLARAPSDRLRRPLPVPPPRPRDADRGDHGGPDRGLRGGQGPRDRLQRMDAGADPRPRSRSRARRSSSPRSRSTT